MNYSGFRIPGNWWGKLIGGIIGLMRGGIVGAIFGVFLGHIVDRFLSGLSGNNRTRDTFFCALFSTIGHISKVDGRVTKKEIKAAEELMQRLQLNEKERQQAIYFFQQGKDPDFDLHGKLHEFATRSKLRYELRIMFMELLLEVAVSDGMLSVGEDAILERVRTVLKIPINVYIAMLRAREAEPQAHYRPNSRKHKPAVNKPQPLSQSYAVLGLKTDASAQEVKRAYRKLVSQYHPDKLSSQGLPDEVMEMAKKRVREINGAYDRIKASRAIK
ncbi:MAG: co-chaperone DjlA [Xanthomonadales bacterium]|jgi:DnaJ like chaperone protein|nr:co-chaperone DjlA [Xanthomonadales bacterium]MDH4019098.1 co-chaperone DjlA [Xanthomonadales bacterium]